MVGEKLFLPQDPEYDGPTLDHDVQTPESYIDKEKLTIIATNVGYLALMPNIAPVTGSMPPQELEVLMAAVATIRTGDAIDFDPSRN